ncbi:hypothetical protein [Leptospira noguchii]|uniref:hypothetical protein n=1 Tax=Leptospira noguchii TaxID=28182 RepID=UPI001FB68D69|nr:hypothetical protein [Leptospira noguchii]UOG30420.1 hypothetical protein MAL06_17940 [Leptospira noguchii]
MWGGNLVLQRICRNSHRFNIEIQILVGKVMPKRGWGRSFLQRIYRRYDRFILRSKCLWGSLRGRVKPKLHFPELSVSLLRSLDRSR